MPSTRSGRPGTSWGCCNEKKIWQGGTFRPAILLFAADASVGGNGQQGISQLGQDDTQQIQFVRCQLAGQGVGNGCDRGSQFAGIQKITSPLFYAGR